MCVKGSPQRLECRASHKLLLGGILKKLLLGGIPNSKKGKKWSSLPYEKNLALPSFTTVLCDLVLTKDSMLPAPRYIQLVSLSLFSLFADKFWQDNM